ncbi:hypothetical protein G7046_g3710 [Stylonectria norvegica]|nr:hypothetical protein G7046_g3710 [Stylonectria norvegica]
MSTQRKPKSNPIEVAIQRWVASTGSPRGIVDEGKWREDLLHNAPKRFTIYEPMALLPSGSFTSLPWLVTFSLIGQEGSTLLWSMILEELSKRAKGILTHLAINEGIPLHKNGVEDDDENILRSPSGLRMLHGDFGPSEVSTNVPSREDFDKAFWVSTKQNGILQTWAPRWTMFSRGNIKEKARLLDMGTTRHDNDRTSAREDAWAVDLYAGIGYFVFCYASLGMRVLCWEINPWSVEGLRRGARANKWSIKVVQGEDLEQPVEDVLAGDEQILVFLESNEEALRKVIAIQALGVARDIRHINCGFLPTSEPTWRPAWEISASSSSVKLHLHENVGVKDTESRRQTIQGLFDGWAEGKGTGRVAKVEHVELVKTFAPGVWHCVFDVHVTKPSVT